MPSQRDEKKIRCKREGLVDLPHLLGESVSLGLDVVDSSDHVEGSLRERVVGSREDLSERSDGLLERDELSLDTGEDLGDSERLRHLKREGRDESGQSMTREL